MARKIKLTVCFESEEEYFQVTDILNQLGFSLIADPFTDTGEPVHSIYVSDGDIVNSSRYGYLKV